MLPPVITSLSDSNSPGYPNGPGSPEPLNSHSSDPGSPVSLHDDSVGGSVALKREIGLAGGIALSIGNIIGMNGLYWNNEVILLQ